MTQRWGSAAHGGQLWPGRQRHGPGWHHHLHDRGSDRHGPGAGCAPCSASRRSGVGEPAGPRPHRDDDYASPRPAQDWLRARRVGVDRLTLVCHDRLLADRGLCAVRETPLH